MEVLTGKRPLIDVWHYFVGNLRYKLYYSKKWKKLIRPHILQQIEFRIMVMDTQCYSRGSCKLCGCETTALQMANKACDKPCYPSMMTEFQWNWFYNKGKVCKEGKYVFMYSKKNNKYKILEEKNNCYVQVNDIQLGENTV